MLTPPLIFDLLAICVNYPNPESKAAAAKCQELLTQINPELAPTFLQFQKAYESTDLKTLQERYIANFDIQASCPLDVGHVLFGEDYKRGEFLVQISKIQRREKNVLGHELADHLPNMLTLLAKIGESEEGIALIEKIMIPTLGKMLQTFSQLDEKQNMFKPLFRVIKDLFNIHLNKAQGIVK